MHMAYDFSWHANHGALTDSSAETILRMLMDAFAPQSVLDVGCGDGRWLRQCEALGATTTAGVDGPWTDVSALLIPRDRFVVQNLEERFSLGRKFDLAISLEVAEHVAPKASEGFIANLVAHSDCVLFGAAIPYQGGFRHINERWQSDWAQSFARHRYRVFDLFRNLIWSSAAVHFWYKQNMLIYINEDRTDLLAAAERYLRDKAVHQLPLDVVHPDKYQAIASYDQIAFKPLLRKLPRKVLEKAHSVIAGLI
jgi:SAM-dependent methyltransferase